VEARRRLDEDGLVSCFSLARHGSAICGAARM
jgi:hypothetical protein